eukprot:5672199-Pleurochrysis_carterae.AAC.3
MSWSTPCDARSARSPLRKLGVQAAALLQLRSEGARRAHELATYSTKAKSTLRAERDCDRQAWDVPRAGRLPGRSSSST